MICPQCKTDNPASSVTCVKCSTPFPFSEQTLAGTLAGGTPPAPDSTSNSADVTFADATSAWSIAVAPSSVAAAVPGEQLVGTTLANRYEIISLLGEGGMGAVYKARDTELDRLVAIKLIRPELAKDPEMLRRFKQELILARQITHKNVIRIFDLGQSDGIKFITMELVEGRNLRSLLLERGKLPPEQAARIMLQICRALEAAHSEGVIHRDLKPQNIMLDASGRVTVMDFGIARSAYLPGMTQTGALIGTPEYMSPEQARGEKLTERSDLFSLGVILYELLIGTSPYQSDTPLATLWKRMNEKVTPPVTVDPTLPPALSDIVVKALEVEPENRFASTAEMGNLVGAFRRVFKDNSWRTANGNVLEMGVRGPWRDSRVGGDRISSYESFQTGRNACAAERARGGFHEPHGRSNFRRNIGADVQRRTGRSQLHQRLQSR
jgi:serine/threonine protein kinase